MKSSLRTLFLSSATAAAIALSCGDSAEEQVRLAALSQGCTLNTDCRSPLVCAFQRCHNQCKESRDCPAGQRCVVHEGDDGVCQLPDETSCTSSSACKGDQICAEDRECRDGCTSDTQCLAEQECSNSGACAEEDELDADGNLPRPGSGGSAGSGTGGSGGRGGSTGKGGSGGSATAGDAGQGGDAGETARGGSGGTGGSGGSSGAGDAGETGAGGDAGSSGSGNAGTGGTGPTGCLESLGYHYAVRTDGFLLHEPSSAGEQPILSSEDAEPLSSVTSTTGTATHGCASRSDGSAWCWRLTTAGNSQGQLGIGTTDSDATLFRALRVRVSDSAYLEDVARIGDTSSEYQVFTNCAVKNDGSAWCWGNTSQLLNNGASRQDVYATQVMADSSTPLDNVVMIALSWGHACALLDAGAANEVWCWGDNNSGEVGNGGQARVQYPTKVLGLTNPSKVVVTAETSCALDADRIKCWGRNSYKEAGINDDLAHVLSPTLVKESDDTVLDDVVDIASGGNEVCALRSDRSLWCWGNAYNVNYAAPIVDANDDAISNVTLLGHAYPARYLTSDGQFHAGPAAWAPDCGSLD